MESKTLYRRYRPKNLDEVVGQEHITRTLKNQLKSGSINHAYLFCGSRGIGKTSIARIFAKAINCPNAVDGNPCNKCEICELLSKENLDVIEIDAASNNRVDEIRELREKVKFPPINTKRKVYIIDEVHMLTDSAFNALLKTLEEPPAHTIFILATTEPQKLPATILSRCIRFDFKLLSNSDLENLLKKVFADAQITSDEASLKLIADAASGSARDLLSLADMCASFCNNNLTYEKVLNVLGAIDKNLLLKFNKNILEGNIEEVFKIYNSLLTAGKGVNVLIKENLAFFRDLIILKTCENAKDLTNLPEEIFAKMQELAKSANQGKIVQIIDALSKLEIDIKNTLNPNLLFEAFIISQTLSSGDVSANSKTASSPAKIKPEVKQNQPASAEKPSSTYATSETSFIKVFGKLLTELKNQGYMALYGLLSEINSGKIENGFLIGFAADNTSFGLVEKEANKALINTIISDVLGEGLKFKIEIVQKNTKDSFANLENYLGDKLRIE